MRYVTKNMKRVFVYVAILGISMAYVFSALTGKFREETSTAVQIGRIDNIDEAHGTLIIAGVELSNDPSPTLQISNRVLITQQTSIFYAGTTIRFGDLRAGDFIRVCSVSRGKERKAVEIQKYGRSSQGIFYNSLQRFYRTEPAVSPETIFS
jgi:hypothetical protein